MTHMMDQYDVRESEFDQQSFQSLPTIIIHTLSGTKLRH